MKNTYKIDFVNNTLTMTKAFEDAASNPTSQEYKLLPVSYTHLTLPTICSV